MALTATPYRVRLTLSDTDRGIYESCRFTIARHPSETEARLTARLLAYGLWWHEDLAFGRGLSDGDEPALVRRAADGRVEHWVDVGRPDPERMAHSARHNPRASVLAFGATDAWLSSALPRVAELPGLEIAVLPRADHRELSRDLPRSLDWGLMITDGVPYVSDAAGTHELALEWPKRLARQTPG